MGAKKTAGVNRFLSIALRQHVAIRDVAIIWVAHFAFEMFGCSHLYPVLSVVPYWRGGYQPPPNTEESRKKSCSDSRGE
jgi:hypothetical protein